MTGVGDDSRGRLLGRPWLVVGFVLAIGATLALVLSNDLKYLRLGIVAALWAALIGAFLAVKYRKHAAQSEDAVSEAQAVYELELEREIAARREYELEVEAENRSTADSRGREELEALRVEVSALRDSLQSLFGGEVLLERVALTAQATRMRKVSDDNRMIPDAAPKKRPAQLMAGKKPAPEGGERPTELIDRVLDERRRKASNGKPANGKGLGKGKGFGGKPGTGPKAPANVNAQSTQQIARPAPLSERRPPVPEVDPALNAAQRELKAAELRAEAARRQAESQPMRLPDPAEVAKQPERRPETPADPTRRDMPRSADPKTEIRRPEPKTEIRRPEPPPARRAEMSRPEMRPAEVSRPDIPRVEMSRSDLPRVPNPNGARPEPRKAPEPPARPPQGRPAASVPPPNPSEMSRSDIRPVERPVADLSAAFQKRDDFAERQRPNRPKPPEPKPADRKPLMPRDATGSRTDLPAVPRRDPSGSRTDMPAVSRRDPSGSRTDLPAVSRRDPSGSRTDMPAVSRRDPAASRTDLPVVPMTMPVPSAGPPSRTNLPPVVPPTTPVPAADGRRPSRLDQFSRADMSPILDEPPSRHGSHRAPAEAAQADAPVNPTLPESVRNFQGRPGGGGGRRRKPDESQQMPAVPPPPPEPSGGRRRRPDGEPPAWEGMVAERASLSRRNMTPVDPADLERNGNGQNGHSNGQNGNGQNGHGNPNGNGQAPRNGHRSTEVPGSGSHNTGRSVSELLAANGGTGSTPRRRRRAED
jgi:hypothetical protein